jgi:hypothetical protein
MLSTQTRLRLQEIADKIERKEEVSLEDMIWAEKWRKNNRAAAEIIRKARRISIQGKGEKGSLDEFLQIMNLGNPDPSEYRTHFSGPDDIVDFFRNDDNMRRD